MASDDIETLLKQIKEQSVESDKKLLSLWPDEFSIPEDISLIQNKYGLISNTLQEMKSNISDRIRLVDNTELVMKLLNYKMYEIRYNFSSKIDRLKEERRELESAGITRENESQIALKLVEIQKEITNCEQTNESALQRIREQMLEAQEDYEKSVNMLDDSLDIMKKLFNNLLLLIEAEKALLGDLQVGLVDIKHVAILGDFESIIDQFIQLQTEGWKSKRTDEDITELDATGLKLTSKGLLVTELGRQISYHEVREKNLLDDMRLFDLITDKKIPEQEENASAHSRDETKISVDSRMSSEDVCYLKEQLGSPLTLALAEITAVQPKDPVHYLGHWLFKYRYNQEISEIQKNDLEQLNDERERIAKDKWHKFIEVEARAAVIDMIVKAEEEAVENELMRIQKEQQFNEEAEENLEEEARDKFDTFG